MGLLSMIGATWQAGCDWVAHRAQRDIAARTRELGELCREIRTGDPWRPNDARARGYAVEEEAGGRWRITRQGAVSSCVVQVEDGRVKGVDYLPD